MIRRTLWIVALCALIALLTLPIEATRAVSGDELLPPSVSHPFGTDGIGRDLLIRSLQGGRRTLINALIATSVAMLPALVIGLLSARASGLTLWIIDSALDGLLALPPLLIPLVLLAVFGSGAAQVAVAVGLGSFPYACRLIATGTRTIWYSPYVEAARSLGNSGSGILVRHVLPNSIPLLVNLSAVVATWAILNGAALYFLGFGGDPSIPEWGAMVNEGRLTIRLSIWPVLIPAAWLFLTVLSINLLADRFSEHPASVQPERG